MLTVYHNNRCSKSRAALEWLDEHEIPYTVYYYLEQPLNKTALKKLLKQLKMQPSELVRKNEDLYKELSADISTEDGWLNAMVKHPKLIERPIVVNGDKVIIARPAERITEIL